MKLHLTLSAAAVAVVLSAPAFAGQCPTHVKKIEAAMAGATLGQDQMAEVHRLHAEGQRLHAEGKHQQSMEALGKAEKMLGIM